MKWIAILLILISFAANAQDKKHNKKYRDSVAKESVQTLKEGVLLVRLRSGQKTLSALLKRGDTIGERNKAREIRLKQLEIINAFKVNYSFSEVYFFYSHDSKPIKENNWDGIVYNDSLKPVLLAPTKFLVVDPYQATFSSMGTSQTGISVLGSDFKQLEKPFPYYVRKRKGIFFITRDHFEMVAILQKNLEWITEKYEL